MIGKRRPRPVVIVLQSTAVGGMESHAIDLAGEYVRRNVPTSLVIPEEATFDGIAQRAQAKGVRVARLTTDGRNGRGAQLHRWVSLARLLVSTRPGAVHLHTGGATGGLAVLATARLLTRAAVVLTEHDVPAPRPALRQMLIRHLVDRFCHTVVAVSRRNARLRRERLGMHCRNFAAVLNGVPLPDVVPSSPPPSTDVRASLGLPDDAVVLGGLVRLAPGKGLEILLRAFAQLSDLADCRLLLVGDGPLREPLQRLAQDLGLGERVLFAGHQSQPEPFLRALDVFVLAVPAGSMSIALLEAMALGVPPVITFCGPEEAVIPGETGLGAAPDDAVSLAVALRALATDAGLRRRLGASAREHVARHFSVSRVADDLLACYAARERRIPARLSAAAPDDPRPGDLLRPPVTMAGAQLPSA